MDKIEGCYCEFASETAKGLNVMCQYCVGVIKEKLRAMTQERDELKTELAKVKS